LGILVAPPYIHEREQGDSPVKVQRIEMLVREQLAVVRVTTDDGVVSIG